MRECEPQHPAGERQPENEPIPPARFDLGQVFITRGALDSLEVIGRHPVQLLARHIEGKWGDLDEHDKMENEQSADQGYRILSAYNIDDTRFYVITEWDRSYTTVLLPEEY